MVLEMTSAMRFPEPEVPVKPERIARSGMRIGGTTVPLTPQDGAGKALKLSATPKADGLATVWAEGLPRELDMKPDAVEHYLAEVGATEVREKWTKAGRGRWHERYVKYTKSFVTVGAPRDDRSWTEPVGLALEIVPKDDPARLTPGRFSVQVREDGKPAVGLSVAAAATGGKVTSTGITDGEGQVSLKLDKAGPWLIKAIRIRAGDAAGDWNSRFTTLTVDVREVR